jgi:hypothetical protein
LSRAVHVWTTFISGWVINYDSLFKTDFSESSARSGIGSSFIQLTWLLPLFTPYNRFTMVTDVCIFATSSNSGGYDLINTFGINFPSMIRAHLPDKVAVNAILNRFCRCYYPRLIARRFSYAYRNMTISNPSLLRIVHSLGSYIWFWVFCLPLILAPSFALKFLTSQYAKILKSTAPSV